MLKNEMLIQEDVNPTEVKDLFSVVNSLPKILNQCVSAMDTPEEKRMALYAISCIAGAIMPNVWVNYDNAKSYPALMLVISYPPASGKGKLSMLSTVLRSINDEINTSNAKASRKFISEMAVYERGLKKGDAVELPTKPNLKLLLIPGNTTSAKLTEQLAENDGMTALMFETEIDSFSNMANGTFGGDNSVTLRKAFHHETLSSLRKNKDHYEANCPKLAVVLSGTHSQVPKLFHSNNDGLLSRFLILMGDAPLEWKDVKPCPECISLNDVFDNLSGVFYSMYHFFENKNVEVQFTDDQWVKINKFGEDRLKESFDEAGANATSIAKRHGNMIVRLASIFSMVRYYDRKDDVPIVFCNDVDFENALWMIEQSYVSSIELFKMLPGESAERESSADEFLDELPDTFQTKELAPLKTKLRISDRTVCRHLKKLVDRGALSTPKKGFYKKAKLADLADGGLNIQKI